MPASTAMVGTAAGGMQGADCTTDYLIIPNPTTGANDRFCGMGIAATTSECYLVCKVLIRIFSNKDFIFFLGNTAPFVLYYITNADEANDVGNRGFSFQYAQNACPISVG